MTMHFCLKILFKIWYSWTCGKWTNTITTDTPWAELFLVAVDDLLATSYRKANDVADKSKLRGKSPTSRVVTAYCNLALTMQVSHHQRRKTVELLTSYAMSLFWCAFLTSTLKRTYLLAYLCQKWKVKLIFRGAYKLSGTGFVECLEIVDVGCNLKQFDGLTWLTLTAEFKGGQASTNRGPPTKPAIFYLSFMLVVYKTDSLTHILILNP